MRLRTGAWRKTYRSELISVQIIEENISCECFVISQLAATGERNNDIEIPFILLRFNRIDFNVLNPHWQATEADL